VAKKSVESAGEYDEVVSGGGVGWEVIIKKILY